MEFTDCDLADWVGQLRAYLLPRIGSKELANELAQEAATRLLRVLREGQEIRQPRAWVFHVARNLAVDEVRKRLPHSVGLEWRSREVDPSSVEEEEHLLSLADLEVPRSEVLRIMPEAMGRLPKKDRIYLDSYYCKGRDFDWIAEEQDLSVSTIKGRLFRARKRLREQIVHQAREEQGKW
ncbi:MAG: sigma-70 family RNA polymerase sigma factor [Planctomycetota bacterium]